MRLGRTALMTLLALRYYCAYAQNNEQYEADTSNYIVQAIDSNAQNSIWPGFLIRSMPSLFSFQNGQHLYIYPQINPTVPWETRQVAHEYLNYFNNQDTYTVPGYPLCPYQLDENNKNLFALDLTLKSDLGAYYAAGVFVHERFHCYQFSHFKLGSLPDYASLRNLENAAQSYYQDSKLIDFLTDIQNSGQNTISDDIYNNENLKTFLAFDIFRRKQFLQSSSSQMDAKFEDWKEILEGTADYASIFSLPGNEKEKIDLIIGKQERLCQATNSMACLSQWRYYSIGFATELALSKLNIENWQEKIQDEFISPVEILENIWLKKDLLNSKKVDKIVSDAKVTEKYRQINEAISTNISKYNEILVAALKQFNTLEPNMIRLQFDNSNCTGGGSNEGGLYDTALKQLNYNISATKSCYNAKTKTSMAINYKNIPVAYSDSLNQNISFNILDTAVSIDLGDGKGPQNLSSLLPPLGKSVTYQYSHLELNTENNLFSADSKNTPGLLTITSDKQSNMTIVSI